jgi:holliday junction DNA helicase RuvA
MISYLKGKILNKGRGFVILLVGDIGYKVRVNATQYVELEIRQPAELYIYHHVREDSQELYGFNDMEGLEMFELLLSISGIGPKSAINALAIASVKDLKESIAHGDPTLLNKVSGIGKKTAERVVLELRDKVDYIKLSGITSKTGGGITGDEIDALMALGYNLIQAREALKKVDPKVKDSGERIRAALKGLGK